MEKQSLPEQNTVNTVKAKNDFNRIVAQITQSREPMIVEKRGTPVAVILDYESYNALQQSKPSKNSQDLVSRLRNFHKFLKKHNPPDTSHAADILRDIRKERFS